MGGRLSDAGNGDVRVGGILDRGNEKGGRARPKLGGYRARPPASKRDHPYTPQVHPEDGGVVRLGLFARLDMSLDRSGKLTDLFRRQCAWRFQPLTRDTFDHRGSKGYRRMMRNGFLCHDTFLLYARIHKSAHRKC